MLNEGRIDRIARVVFGVALFLALFFVTRTAWAFLALIPIATGAVGFCPLYRVLGVSTCRTRTA
jgi:hypothetical protein